MNVTSATSHPTPLGELWSSWTSLGLYRLSWDPPQRATPASSAQVVQLDQLLQEYFQTGRANFHSVEIDPTGWTEFSRRDL